MSNIYNIAVVFLQPKSSCKQENIAIYCDAHCVPLLINSKKTKDNLQRLFLNKNRMTVPEIQQLVQRHKKEFKKYFSDDFYLTNLALQDFKKHELNALCLLSIEEPFELAKFLTTPIYHLEELLNNPPYKHFTIQKKRGGTRQIFAPENSLKGIQKRLNYFLQAYYLWLKPHHVHGFVINPHYLGTSCNIVENAKVHVSKNFVLNIDLKDFFHSITANQVKDIFSSHFFNFSEPIAIALTLLTTYKGKLPIGAPTSPVLSNFICHELDDDLLRFSAENDLTFTRYADDLTFSSNFKISHDITLDIINLIKKNFFEINSKKIHLKTQNRKQIVTGLTVNQKVNVDKKLLKKIRAMLHDVSINGIEKAAQRHFKLNKIDKRYSSQFMNRLEGYINFVGQVRGKGDTLVLKFKEEFKLIFEIEIHKESNKKLDENNIK
ncbi:RNA-directed DNA polymerase [Flavobacterium branchiophilum]|uniref:RNA-directed DNA polymerase n=2 Tax=Flavobacterium branchiophilum TaxID=55197 RepID=A0A543G857_9FLAO|nr:RNA-directed DNA polymerase [Flavobacterium branchiophilum]